MLRTTQHPQSVPIRSQPHIQQYDAGGSRGPLRNLLICASLFLSTVNVGSRQEDRDRAVAPTGDRSYT